MIKILIGLLIITAALMAEVYDQIIPETNEHPYKIFYNYNYKEPVKVQYKTSSETVYQLNIIKRPGFKSDKNIPREYRSYTSDYTGTGYDRGHMAPDALFDYNQTVLNNVYLMSNITPQLPNLNRKVWKRLEFYIRYQTMINDSLKIENYIFFEAPIKRIGSHKIAVPAKFLKVIHFPKESKRITECYLFINKESELLNRDPMDYRISNKLCNFYRNTLHKNQKQFKK
jgi:endonuclease G